MEAPKVLLAGHSHITCFGVKRSRDRSVQIIGLHDHLPVFGVQAPVPRPPNFVNQVARLSRGYHLAALWTGNQHQTKFLLAPDPLFDFISSTFPHLPLHPDASLVPEALVENSLGRYVEDLTEALSRFSNSECASLSVLCPPPPKKDDGQMLLRIQSSEGWMERINRRGVDPNSIKIMPAFIRLKLWALMQRITERVAREHKANFIPVPKAAQDEIGFLRDEYAADDVTHANTEYGKLYLEKLLTALSSKDLQVAS
jgi:hypothetical protein